MWAAGVTPPAAATPATAQETVKTVTGKVTDSKGQPLPGVTIIIKGTTQGTITDANGNYRLPEVPGNAVLVFSFVGMKTQELAVTNRSYITVTMQEERLQLNETIVVGYGSQKKADLTSAISTLGPKEVLKAPGGVTDALQGSIAGVNVSGGKIRIRGTSSITGGTDPLWVVDGVIDGAIPNEDEIASIQVLKDAASCAIYGVRGANGVILVTTKQGQPGAPRIHFNAYTGTETPAKKLKMMNAYDYGVYVNELYYNASDAASIAGGTWNQTVPTHNANPGKPLADTRWWDQYFSRTTTQKYDLSVSGATPSSKYLFGVTYSHDGNEMDSYENEFQNIYSNIQGTKGRFTYGGQLQIGYNQTDQNTGASLMNMLMLPPNLPVYNEDGSFYKTGINETDGNDLSNQAWYLHNEKERNRSVSARGNVFGEFRIFDWLKYRVSYSYSFARNNDATFTPEYDLGASRQDYNSQSTTKGGSRHKIIENLLSYDKTLGKHSVSGVLGVTSEKSVSWSLTTAGHSDEQTDFGLESKFTDSQTISSSETDLAYFSYLARLMYSYNSKYMFTVNFRADESSKFAAGNRWGYFPSFSAGWRISEEPWMKEATAGWLDNLKIRATLGWIGSANAVGAYDYQSVVETNNRYYTLGANQGDNAADSNVPAPLPESIANKSLTWETTRDAGVGFDMTLLNSRLDITFDYYNRKVSDMLLDVQLPESSGTTNSVPMNVGSMTNRGIEFSATYRQPIGDVRLTVSPNFSLYRNKVNSLGDNESLAGGSIASGANVTRTVAGKPVAQFWGYKTDGLFKTDQEAADYVNSKGERLQPSAAAGDLKYVDVNGDGAITDGDKTFIGSSLPDWSMGLNIMAEYKGFDLSALFQGDFGYDIYNNWKSELMGGYCAKNQMAEMNDRFRATDVTFTTAGGETITLPANTHTSVPRAVLNDPNNNHTNASDYFVEDGSYLRCNRITLGYTLSSRLADKVKMEKLRIYAGVKNPFTITGYSMFDPQVPGNGSTLNRGVDGSYYWSSDTYWSRRQFFAGVQLTF
ncbi:SusC/RagA family TonB-linked outer membrane protein [Prolixibacter sp. NT017]|nr:SusC/RagA family TonB-linked outer membrane protein [Prolixibacter sp. NT017]